MFSKQRKAGEESAVPEKNDENSSASESTAAEQTAPTPVSEPKGYVSGKDRFLDRLTVAERNEFYNAFIYKSTCGLQYKPGADNGEFFSGAFLKLSAVMFVVSDGLMRKICMEYDRVRGLPVSAD